MASYDTMTSKVRTYDFRFYDFIYIIYIRMGYCMRDPNT